MSTLADLEARVAALEADRADYRAVLAAVGALREETATVAVKTDANREAINALGANQRELAEGQRQLKGEVSALKSDMNARIRSVEEGQAEIKDLLIRALDK